ncbi:MAG: hypothetical protein Q9226_005832, partial [Calogaya cf. arnoldii]
MLAPKTSQYTYVDKLIREAVDSFNVQPRESAKRDSGVHLPDVVNGITGAYEKLKTLGIDVEDVNRMMAKLV